MESLAVASHPLQAKLLAATRSGFARCRKNGRQFACFLLQPCQQVGGHKIVFTGELQPKLDFISFLFGDAELCNKFCARTGFTCCSIVCGSGRPRASELIREHSAFNPSREFVCQIGMRRANFFVRIFNSSGFMKRVIPNPVTMRKRQLAIGNWKLEMQRTGLN